MPGGGTREFWVEKGGHAQERVSWPLRSSCLELNASMGLSDEALRTGSNECGKALQTIKTAA